MVRIGVSTSKNPSSSKAFLAAMAALLLNLNISSASFVLSSRYLYFNFISSFTLLSPKSKGIGSDLFSIISSSTTTSIVPVFKFGFSKPSPLGLTFPFAISTNSSLTLSANFQASSLSFGSQTS